MKTSTLRGLGSSLLLNVGLAKVAAKVDPVASLSSGGSGAAAPCVFPTMAAGATANGTCVYPCMSPSN